MSNFIHYILFEKRNSPSHNINTELSVFAQFILRDHNSVFKNVHIRIGNFLNFRKSATFVQLLNTLSTFLNFQSINNAVTFVYRIFIVKKFQPAVFLVRKIIGPDRSQLSLQNSWSDLFFKTTKNFRFTSIILHIV